MNAHVNATPEVRAYTYLVSTEKAQWIHAIGIRMDIDTDTNNLNIYDSNGDIRYVFNKWDRVEVMG